MEIGFSSAKEPPAVQVRGLSKAYRNTLALDALDCDVAPGQILGLVGPNGAGKTTTLRILCGILPPTEGEVTICGHSIATDPVGAKRRLAYVPDDPQLFDNLTVGEHFELVARMYGLTTYCRRAEALVERFVLTEKRHAVAAELSRGMRQKVAIACAYLHDPAVLLLDEPLTGLDPRGIRDITNSILTQRDRGAAVIISSHLLSLVEELSDRILILHRGKRLICGDLATIRSGFPDLERDASLEDVFFRATEGSEEAPQLREEGERGGDGQ